MSKRNNRPHAARLDTSAMLSAPKPAIAQVRDGVLPVCTTWDALAAGNPPDAAEHAAVAILGP